MAAMESGVSVMIRLFVWRSMANFPCGDRSFCTSLSAPLSPVVLVVEVVEAEELEELSEPVTGEADLAKLLTVTLPPTSNGEEDKRMYFRRINFVLSSA